MKKVGKSSKKGFTLVELIVVLVILAILAAMLVPALVGYIDRAKKEKEFQAASTIYAAAQALATEAYGKGDPSAPAFADMSDIEELTGITNAKITEVEYGSGTDIAEFTIQKIKVQIGGNNYYYQVGATTWGTDGYPTVTASNTQSGNTQGNT